jgi:hypothetical protein
LIPLIEIYRKRQSNPDEPGVYGNLESRRFTSVDFELPHPREVVINTERRRTPTVRILFRNVI